MTKKEDWTLKQGMVRSSHNHHTNKGHTTLVVVDFTLNLR
ncbi:hypothetical protein VCHA53O464_390002 [Vibrio chagasii]|nr:hypothetical protein VCHA53O464_390002 [Vibrio chagasii]